MLAQINWVRAVLGAVAAEAALIASAFGWVTIYSYLIHPGETVAFYQRYAEASGPWLSLIVGMPIFFLAGRWIGGRATGLAMFGLFLACDLAVLLAYKASPPVMLIGASGYLTKLAATWLGAGSRAG